MTRRILVRWVLSFLAVAPFRRVRLFAQVRSLEEADISTLTDLAEAALPSSLGREGAEATVHNQHSPNENLRMGHFFSSIVTMAAVLTM